MRTNAQEPNLLKQITMMNREKEAAQMRDEIVPSLFRPLTAIMKDLPNIVCAFIGGRLALGGTISGADLTSFSAQANRLVHSADVLQEKMEQVGKYRGFIKEFLQSTVRLYTVVYNATPMAYIMLIICIYISEKKQT